MSSKIKSLIHSLKNLFLLVTKPTKEEFWLIFKVVIIGISIVGIYAFIIQLIAFTLENIRGIFVPQTVLLVLVIFISIVLFVYYYGRVKGKW